MASDISLYRLAELSNEERETLIKRVEADLDFYIEKVTPVIEAVRERGDEAICHYSRLFDQAALSPDGLRVADHEFEQARQSLDPALVETLEYAAANIRHYHEAQMPRKMWMAEIRPGVFAGERVLPVESAACYSPRGKGSFPSVTLMTAIPAVTAGVKRPVVMTPAGPDGRVDAATLVAAEISGVREVYKAGGPVAMAAAAYGTQSIAPCLKFEGPGSPWLSAARQILASVIHSRLPAGPSESIVLADDSADPKKVALDTLIESEHGADSSVFMITTSEKIAAEVIRIIPDLWETMTGSLKEASEAVLKGTNGGIIIAPSISDAYDFINDYAPEHLQIHSTRPINHLENIQNASEILLGDNLPGSVANYLLGPNCVLPTGGFAKTHSPLGVRDFLKTASIGSISDHAYEELASHTERFARYEGFDAHANAVGATRN